MSHVIAEMMKAELKKLGEVKESHNNYVVLCPFHNEDTPSFNVNVDPSNRRVPLGHGHCFGCGASKKWNQIAEALNLRKIDEKGMSEATAYVRPSDKRLKDKLLGNKEGLTINKLAELLGVRMPIALHESENWRGFSAKTLTKIGVVVGVDDYDNKALVMPVIVDGIIEGGIKALWYKPSSKKMPKYKNLEGEWAKHSGLFPYDYIKKAVKKKGYIVLVEGARDALRLIRRGVPALAILGTQTWSQEKRNLVLQLNPEKVVIMMDCDDAGIKATNAIAKDLKGKIDRQIIPMKKYAEKYKILDLDPGNCPSKLLTKIIHTIEQ